MHPSISFPLSVRFVSDLLVFSEGVPSFKDTSRAPVDRARAHAIAKHVWRQHSGHGPVSSFRSFTEMSQAATTVLNSAWGRFAINQILERGPGTRAVFESAIPETAVDIDGATERVSIARTVIEAPPPHFEPALKLHTFFPVRAYDGGRPWCEFEPPGGRPGPRHFSPERPR